MKKSITLFFLLILNLTTYSQDKKFSIDINYPLAINNSITEVNGIVDGSFKYRFKELDAMTIGAVYTYDLATERIDSYLSSLKHTYHFNHLGGLIEFKIKTVEKLHPFAQAGYTLLTTKSKLRISDSSDPDISEDQTKVENSSGFNLGAGTSYDISERFYLQLYYHYIKVYSQEDFSKETRGYNYDQLKLGVGYRF